MRKSTGIRIGLILLAGVVLAFVVCLLTGVVSFSPRAVRFETYVEKDGQGIGKGSPVSYRGVRIGEVETATLCWTAYRGLIPDSPEGLRAARYVRIVFAIDNSFFGNGDFSPDEVADEVRDGMRLTVKELGSSGIDTLDLDFYEAAPATLPVPWEPKYTYIPCATGLSKSVADSVRDISRSLGAFGSLASNVTELVESSTASVGEGRLTVMGVIDNIERASKSLADALEQIRANPSVLFRNQGDQEDPE